MVGVVQRERRAMRRFWRDEGGAVSIEYSLLMGFIAILVIATIREIGLKLADMFGLVLPGFMGI